MDYCTPTADIDGYVPFSAERAEAYQAAGYWENQPLHDVLDRAGEGQPQQPAVIGEEEALTYAELIERSRRVGAFLAGELGLDPLERIVIQVTNRMEFVELLFGCSRAGVIPVLVLPRHREAEARHIADLTAARAYVTVGDASTFDFTGMVDGIVDELPTLDHRIALDGTTARGWIDYGSAVDREPSVDAAETLDSVEVNPSNPAVFLLSGGTTGMPKAIPRTHNDYVFQWKRMTAVTDARPDWRSLPCGPISHNGPILGVLAVAIVSGSTLVVQETLKPTPLLETIDRFDVNYFWAAPTQLIDFLEHPDIDGYDLSTLDALLSGGQKIPPWTVREFAERWDATFLNAFGMGEGPLISTRPGDDLAVQTETVGRPIAPEADECIIVDQDRENRLPPGQPGELAARGPGYFTGYFRNPEENAENVDDDGWFYTEDVLEIGEDGNFRVHGRLKDTIIRGGENIYAPGVEDEVIEHPKVARVAVVGLPDERLGERVAAFVELEDDATTLTVAELADFLDDRGVAVFKRPEWIEVRESLPRTEVGKLDKETLKDDITSEANPEEDR